MTGEELRAVKAAEHAARAAVPPPPKPHQLDVVPRLQLRAEQLAQARAMAQKRGVSLVDALLTLGTVTEDDVIAREAELTSGLWASTEQLAAVERLEHLPKEVCQAMLVVPLSLAADQLTVAMRDPLDRDVLITLCEHAEPLRVIGIRAGARALQTTLERLSVELDADDPSTWLER